MPLISTLGTLLLMTAAVIALRLRWPGLSRARRRVLLLVAAPILLLPWISFFTGWESASLRLNDLSLWLCILGYLVVVIGFTLLRPRWLTVLIATPFLLLVLSSSVLAPLSSLFQDTPYRQLPLGNGYFVEIFPWSSGPGENSGIDWDAFYQSPAVSFLHRGMRGSRLYNTQCQTANAYATLDLPHRELTMHCPPLTPGQPEFQHRVHLR